MVKETACSVCAHSGHNSRTCNEKDCVKLFGVNIKVHAQRDEAEPAHERKKGKAWTENEHQLFLTALKKIGRGNWKKISMEYVTTKTPTQVASHAQKFFIRQALTNKKNRRSSIFDLPSHEAAQVTPKPLRKTFEISRQGSTSIDQIVNELPRPCLDPVIPIAATFSIPNYPYMGTSIVPLPSRSYIETIKYYQISAYLLRCKSYQKFNNCGASPMPILLHQSTFQTGSTSSIGKDESLELKIGPS